MMASEEENTEFFKASDNMEQKSALAELEDKLFGIHRPAL